MKNQTDPSARRRAPFRFVFVTCPLCLGRGFVAADNFGPSGVQEHDVQCRRCWGTGSVTLLQQPGPHPRKRKVVRC